MGEGTPCTIMINLHFVNIQ